MSVIQFPDIVSDILATETEEFAERDPGTFFAAHIGLCPRQLYLSKLGLTAQHERRGQYRISRLIQSYLDERVAARYPRLEVGASAQVDKGPLQFVGRCNLFDPEVGIAYTLKTRNGWYKFSPPVERHLDQLHVYMRGLGVDEGQLVYISKNDLDDIRVWPPTDDNRDTVTFDEDRWDKLVAKATKIRDEVWTNGIATTPEDIPFPSCGCYFCRNETLSIPPDADQDTTSNEEKNMGSDGEERELEVDVPTPSGRNTKLKAGGRGQTTSSDNSLTALESTSTHVPAPLRDRELWVVWDGRSKVPLAPWQEGTMYPCEWSATADVDPRRVYSKAHMIAELPVPAIHRSWPFPDETNLPETVTPAVLLPHNPPSQPVAVIDLDAVRNPETGRISSEAAQIIEMLGGYTEVSQSGTGVHVYGRGCLPPGTGAVSAPLADCGSIEIYDHSRFVASTWQHVELSPPDRVPQIKDELRTLASRYLGCREQI